MSPPKDAWSLDSADDRTENTENVVQVIATCFSGTSVMVSCHTINYGYSSELPSDMNPDVEEADARIILHAMHAVNLGQIDLSI